MQKVIRLTIVAQGLRLSGYPVFTSIYKVVSYLFEGIGMLMLQPRQLRRAVQRSVRGGELG